MKRTRLTVALIIAVSLSSLAGFYVYNYNKASPQKASTTSPSLLSTSLTSSTNAPEANVPVTFTARTSGGTPPYNIHWSFGDGSAGSANVTSHTYKTVGAFTAVETATDSGSPVQTARASMTFTVTTPPSPPSGCTDPESISSHVYHPYRLQIVNQCISASGTVDAVIEEDDGDVHIRLSLDSAYSNLTNSANDQYQHGDLVVEIICVYQPIQADAIPACQNYTNQIPVPDVGQHITVTGPYVLDTEHYDWAEIHPMYSLVISAPQRATVSVTEADLDISYPDGSSYGWLGPTPRAYSGWHVVRVNAGDEFTTILSFYSTSSASEEITSLTVTTPGFSITSVTPNPPITFDSYATVDIALMIQTPNSSYDGPLDIQITTA